MVNVMQHHNRKTASIDTRILNYSPKVAVKAAGINQSRFVRSVSRFSELNRKLAESLVSRMTAGII